MEVMASKQEACTSHTATTVVFCCRHSHCVTSFVCFNCHLHTSGSHHIRTMNTADCCLFLENIKSVICAFVHVISHQRWPEQSKMGLRYTESTGYNVMTPCQMIHKHPDIPSALFLPLAPLSSGLNSFLFPRGFCLAATSCLRCLQCLFVVTWRGEKKKSVVPVRRTSS